MSTTVSRAGLACPAEAADTSSCAFPTATPVATPVAGSTVATDGESDRHVMTRPPGVSGAPLAEASDAVKGVV
jgi:hypothetical protein